MKRAKSPDLDEEIRTSYKRICDIKRKEKGISEQIQALDDEISRLIRERREKHEEVDNLLGRTLEDAIKPYSRSWTLQFVNKMRSTLPRELRDMVYKELVMQQGFMRPWAMADYALGARVRDVCHGPGCICSREVDIPHAMDPSYVGPEIALEVVEAMYKAYPDHFFTVDRVERIKNILLLDHFKVGFKPADAARKMTINWKLSRSVREETKKGASRHRRPVKKDFSPLMKVRNKSGFNLRIIMTQRHIRFYPIERALGIIKPIFQHFIAEGAKVEVLFIYDTSGVVCSLNEAVTQPTATWKKNLADILDENEEIADHHKEWKDEELFARNIMDTSSEDSEMEDLDDDPDDYYIPPFNTHPFGYSSFFGEVDDDDMDHFDFGYI